MRVLMLPSMHPYVSKLAFENRITIVNPDSDYFSLPEFGVDFIEEKHPICSYDLVHIHFSFDKVPIDTFRQVLLYFKEHQKPIVWTCHSKESQRVQNYYNGEYQRLLFSLSDKIITLTEGCRKWIEMNWGKPRNTIAVIPHGLIAMPEDVEENIRGIVKRRNRFTILYGEFRDNKERFYAISDFLNAPQLSNLELHLIYKPQSMFQTTQTNEWDAFVKLTDNPRCTKFVKPWITNEELIKEFYSSHCIILPYLWGTHSGQIELAKDCGCYVIAHDVGFYKEQWDKTILWGKNCLNSTYLEALLEVKDYPALSPCGGRRIKELQEIINLHLSVYYEIVNNDR